MAYQHGVYTSEVPTSIVPAVNTTAGLPVIFGTAPVHLASNPAAANRPVLCYSYAEAVAALGYSKDWKNYTLCEAMYSQFSLYNRAPAVFVNVLDPAKHKQSVEDTEITMTKNEGVLTDPVLLSTLVVKAQSGESAALVQGTDYEAAYDEGGQLVITALEDGAAEGVGTLYASYDKLDPSDVDEDDIIGGVDVSTGAYTGLETLNQVFPLYGLVPGLILAPGWSDKPSVASVMTAKAGSINSHFQAMAHHRRAGGHHQKIHRCAHVEEQFQLHRRAGGGVLADGEKRGRHLPHVRPPAGRHGHRGQRQWGHSL